MFHHTGLTKRELKSLIDKRAITIGGNIQLKIYGTLSCRSGKRMKKENRIFFESEEEAVSKGYRPCGHCMKTEYRKWREKSNEPVLESCHADEGGINPSRSSDNWPQHPVSARS